MFHIFSLHRAFINFRMNNPNSAKKVKPAKAAKPAIKTPYLLFVEHNQSLENKNDANTLRETFANLSHDEKYKWVVKAVGCQPEVSFYFTQLHFNWLDTKTNCFIFLFLGAVTSIFK